MNNRNRYKTPKFIRPRLMHNNIRLNNMYRPPKCLGEQIFRIHVLLSKCVMLIKHFIISLNFRKFETEEIDL